MGQDIHAHIEYQEYDRYWHFAHVKLWRWYDLFAFMATGGSSRRPDIQPVFTPRGVPADIEDTTRFRYESDSNDYSLHHVSWLTRGELNEVRQVYLEWFKQHYSIPTLPNIADVDAVYDAMCALEARGFPTRLIFWFDN